LTKPAWIEVDGLIALLEMDAGSFLVFAAIARNSVEELGLAEVSA
jgi:hypothetical protein